MGKRFSVCLLLAVFGLAVFFSVPGGAAASAEGDQAEAGYAHTLFDTGFVHQIHIRMSDSDWADMQANPVGKTKYHADIEIDGETVTDVSFATKGNSSLFIVAADPDSSRYSYRVNFRRFVEGQTYHGLDKLSLNNSFTDATFMKDYFCYQAFRQLGVPTPFASYAWLTVNGEDRGLYMAVEDEDSSFLRRVSESGGVIYKPESEGLDLSLDMIEDMKANGLPIPTNIHGADFVYQDDDPASYPDIFENIETYAEETDNQAVIAAMKCLAEGGDLEACFDTDEIIRYFAAHNFVLNYDSYTGTMLHNLILMESGGRVSLLPWDYNMAFAAYIAVIGDEAMADATDILNRGIDSPLIGADEDSRPLWKWIAQSESYMKAYHDAMDELLGKYFESGLFEQEIGELGEMLLPYIEKDPTAFYSADEFRKGCGVLKQFAVRRAESVRKQLSGELAAVSSDQSDADKVDASDLRLTDMGVAVPKEKLPGEGEGTGT